MLDQLDTVNWAGLTHAYGSAGDVPDQIRQLRCADRNVRDKALQALYGNIFHQGTRYAASAHVVPFLLELLADPATPDRSLILTLLTHLAIGYDNAHLPAGYAIASHRAAAAAGPDLLRRAVEHPAVDHPADESDAAPRVSGEEALELLNKKNLTDVERRQLFAYLELDDDDDADDEDDEEGTSDDDLSPLNQYLAGLTEAEKDHVYAFFALAAYDAVRAGLPVIRTLLDDPDISLRTTAAHALAWFPEEAAGSLPGLAEVSAGPDAAATATALISIGLLATAEGSQPVHVVKAALNDSRGLVRWGAAIALARLQGPHADVRVAEELHGWVERESEPCGDIPFYNGDLRSYAAQSLRSLGDG